jgi:lambda repressor-like predicted transcriptional regulator
MPQPPAKPLYDAVLAALAAQGRSKNWLHLRSGVARNTIDNWRTRPRAPQSRTVLAVAHALGMDPDEALRLAGVVKDPPEPVREVPDLSWVSTDDLLREVRRRIPD